MIYVPWDTCACAPAGVTVLREDETQEHNSEDSPGALGRGVYRLSSPRELSRITHKRTECATQLKERLQGKNMECFSSNCGVTSL